VVTGASGISRRAVFLDRDGVINRSPVRDGRPYPPPSLAEFELLPGVPEAIAALRAAGFLAIVATNQPDVGAGRQRREVVESMHAKLMAEAPVDAIKVCYCVESPGCTCYKPRPEMLIDAAREWGVDLGRSYMVGDRWRDIDAGHAAGCRTVLVDRRYGEPLRRRPDLVVADLPAAAEAILAEEAGRR
jgi:D-glycero-D-manno-heptose 1,7-bisphosphate phosphatase